MNVPYNWNTHELAFLLQFVPGQKGRYNHQNSNSAGEVASY